MKIMPLTAACAGALAAWPAADAFSQKIADTVVVTATRVERPTFDLPLSIDSVGAARIHEHQAGVNISESLNRVPGTVVQNRKTYAQEQQMTEQGGFGPQANSSDGSAPFDRRDAGGSVCPCTADRCSLDQVSRCRRSGRGVRRLSSPQPSLPA